VSTRQLGVLHRFGLARAELREKFGEFRVSLGKHRDGKESRVGGARLADGKSRHRDPLGICTIDSNESNPCRYLEAWARRAREYRFCCDHTGQMRRTSGTRDEAAGAFGSELFHPFVSASGERCADSTLASYGTEKSVSCFAASRITSQSLALPMTIPTRGERPATFILRVFVRSDGTGPRDTLGVFAITSAGSLVRGRLLPAKLLQVVAHVLLVE